MSDPSATIPIPKKLCDLIMKGGITSGVVYPQGISEIAKHYSLKNMADPPAPSLLRPRPQPNTRAGTEIHRRLRNSENCRTG